MGTGMKIFLGVVVLFFVGILSFGGWIMSARFTAEKHEKGIVYADKNMQSVHSRVQKIVETSGLTVQNFGKTKIEAINAKVKQYADKPDMMMMWIKENPQNIDSKVWEKFQDTMEKQYTDFDNEQKLQKSKSQAYDEWLNGTYKGSAAMVVWSYPRPETKIIMDRVIQTQETKTTFETGIDKTVKVF